MITPQQLLAERIQWVRDTCIRFRQHEPQEGCDVAIVAGLAHGDAKVQAAIELLLRYIESPPEPWREVEP